MNANPREAFQGAIDAFEAYIAEIERELATCKIFEVPASRHPSNTILPWPITSTRSEMRADPRRRRPADVFERQGGQGTKSLQLPAGTLLSLVRTEQGWMLVVSNGQSIGYVAQPIVCCVSSRGRRN